MEEDGANQQQPVSSSSSSRGSGEFQQQQQAQDLAYEITKKRTRRINFLCFFLIKISNDVIRVGELVGKIDLLYFFMGEHIPVFYANQCTNKWNLSALLSCIIIHFEFFQCIYILGKKTILYIAATVVFPQASKKVAMFIAVIM